MYRHILIPTDGSELAQRGVAHGLALAKSVGAKVSIIYVVEPLLAVTGDFASVLDRADATGTHSRRWRGQSYSRISPKQGAGGTVTHIPKVFRRTIPRILASTAPH